MEKLEPELGPGGEFSTFREWAGKLAGAVVRLAGVLHVVSYANDSTVWSKKVSEDTVARAIKIGEYLVPHADAAHQMMLEDSDTSDASYILDWIKRHKPAGGQRHDR